MKTAGKVLLFFPPHDACVVLPSNNHHHPRRLLMYQVTAEWLNPVVTERSTLFPNNLRRDKISFVPNQEKPRS